ncbi:MAG: hypothetical protein ABSB49_00075 [Polyangia bacterium]|jgi:hypothetical protein
MIPARVRRLTPVLFVLSTACHGKHDVLAPSDSYLLLVPAEGAVAGQPLRVRRVDVAYPAVQPLPGLFEAGFASEMLRTVYLAEQFIRDATIDGKRFSDLGRYNAGLPVCLVVGVDRMPYARGLAITGSLFGRDDRPTLPWLGLPAEPGRDKALLQTLASHFAAYAAELIATGGELEAGPPPPRVLVDGYRMALEVVAREWRTTAGPAGVIQSDEGTVAQRDIFALVRENRAILDDSHALRPAREIMASPGVAATVIYRMAQSRAVGPRVAPEAFYAPFAKDRMPPGVSPAAILGSFRNFQAKLLGAWATAVLRGRPPQDIVDLVELYGLAFPAERSEVTRIFVVTTYGATVEAGGASTDAKDAQHTLAELTALSAQVVAGKRTLRDALATPAK